MPRYGPGVRLSDVSYPGTNGRRLVPGAFATLLGPLAGSLAAPPATMQQHPMCTAGHTGTVLGLGPTACYISLDGFADDDRVPAVIPILRPQAVQLPTGVRIGVAGPWPVQAGDPVAADATGIALGGWLVTPARSWQPPRVVASPSLDPGAGLARLTAAWPDADGWTDALSCQDGLSSRRMERLEPSSADARRVVHAATGALVSSVGVRREGGQGHQDARMTGVILRELIGLGPGLTPSGDDALAGCLLTLRLLGEVESLSALAEQLPAHLRATTALSGSLLAAAAEGYAAPELVGLLAGLGCAAPEARLARLVTAVLAIGHSSGADLLTGVHATLAVSAAAGRSATMQH